MIEKYKQLFNEKPLLAVIIGIGAVMAVVALAQVIF